MKPDTIINMTIEEVTDDMVKKKEQKRKELNCWIQNDF